MSPFFSRRMRSLCSYSIQLFLILLLSLTVGSLSAQDDPSRNFKSSVLPIILEQIEGKENDSTLFIVNLLINGHCGTDEACLFECYSEMILEFEIQFNLPLAIYCCDALLKKIEGTNHQFYLIRTHSNLHRFHSALGNSKLAVLHLDKAEQAAQKIDDKPTLLWIKINKIENEITPQNIKEPAQKLEKLLAEIEGTELEVQSNDLKIRLVYLYHSVTDYKGMMRHIEAIERIPESPDNTKIFQTNKLVTALGRADIAFGLKEYDKAIPYYKQGIKLCEQGESKWLEIRTYQSLSEIAIAQKDLKLAKEYAEIAHKKAAELKTDDLLAFNYGLLKRISIKEFDYKSALEHYELELSHREKFESRGANFDVERYYLQKEFDNNKLELKLKETQLRNSILFTILGLCMAGLLAFGYYIQRKRKKELAVQNILIQNQAKRLKNLDESKSRFFANVAHELRTPLSLIIGPLSTLINESKFDYRQRKLTQMAINNGRQLEQLVNEILDLSRLEMGKMDKNFEPTQLYKFFRTYIIQFESLADRKKIEYQYHIDESLNITADIDRSKTRQILYNLLSNAFKFTSNLDNITVQISIANEQIHAVISDSGRGIHPDDLPHIFDRYFQTDKTGKQAEGGSGIGLALCYEFAELLNGEIKASSELNQGSVFSFSIPLIISSVVKLDHPKDILPVLETTTLMSENNAGEKKLKPNTVLVVEDNDELRDYIEIILSENFNIETAANGLEAWEKISSGKKHDLVVSDLMMPEMDGYELLEKIKTEPLTEHLPFIMLTARADSQDRLEALRIGVDDYLIKPFEENELIARIENLIRNYDSRKNELVFQNESKTETFSLNENDNHWLKEFENYLLENISNEKLSIPFLAKQFAMSESSLLRQLKRLSGLSPKQYLVETRLVAARKALESRKFKTVSDVANNVGFNDKRNFTKTFKKRFGKLPSSYLKD